MHPSTSLSDVLSNTLILQTIAPLIPVSSLFSLSATSHCFQSLILNTPWVFRHLDLRYCRGANSLAIEPIDRGGNHWRAERMDEALTEDEFYAGPLRGIFSMLHRKNILKDVHTLILDGLSVPPELVHEILLDDRFNVRTLSIRECRNDNERKLMQTLRYACRPSRPAGTPKLKGLYIFSPVDNDFRPSCRNHQVRQRARSAGGVTTTEGAQLGASSRVENLEFVGDTRWRARHSSGEMAPEDSQLLANAKLRAEEDQSPFVPEHEWYQPTGRVMTRTYSDEWALTLQACQGIIAFDAVLCRGPRHDPNLEINKLPKGVEGPGLLPPALANIALGPTGCEICHSSPEGPAVWGVSPPEYFPLLSPPPTHSSTLAAARTPPNSAGHHPRLIVSCATCLTDRRCDRCNKWWCMDCLPPKQAKSTDTVTLDMENLEVTNGVDFDGRWVGGENGAAVNGGASSKKESIKVFLGLCVENCLVREMMSGSGSAGMWG